MDCRKLNEALNIGGADCIPDAVEGIDYVVLSGGGWKHAEVTIAAGRGGNGGLDANGPGGIGAQGRAGKFAMPDGAKILDFRIGGRGNDGTSGSTWSGGGGASAGVVLGDGDGGRGGNAGLQGWSGAGGGGGAASYIILNGSGGFDGRTP